MSKYHGDIAEDQPISWTINTNTTAAVPVAFAGSPTLAVYKDGGITQSTVGLTLTEALDGVVGLHLVSVVTTDAFYVTGSDYEVVLEAGTVDGVSVVGAVVGSFSIENRFMRGTDGANTVAQTGDSFARLGAPGGASVSEDVADIPTVAEFNARTLVAASYFDPAADAVANVTLVATTTTNTDMRGTDSAYTGTPPTAAAVADAVWDELQSAHVTVGSFGIIASEIAAIPTTAMRGTDSAALASVCTEARLAELDAANLPADIDEILVDTAEIGSAGAGLTSIFTTAMTESYAADGVAPTPAQSLFLIQQALTEVAIVSTTETIKKLDGETAAATLTLNSASAPTSKTRAT